MISVLLYRFLLAEMQPVDTEKHPGSEGTFTARQWAD